MAVLPWGAGRGAIVRVPIAASSATASAWHEVDKRKASNALGFLAPFRITGSGPYSKNFHFESGAIGGAWLTLRRSKVTLRGFNKRCHSKELRRLDGGRPQRVAQGAQRAGRTAAPRHGRASLGDVTPIPAWGSSPCPRPLRRGESEACRAEGRPTTPARSEINVAACRQLMTNAQSGPLTFVVSVMSYGRYTG